MYAAVMKDAMAAGRKVADGVRMLVVPGSQQIKKEAERLGLDRDLGLVEMTRKNVSAGLLESFSEQCPHCEGRGVLLHEEAATHAVPISGTAEDVD